jgi:DNA-binding winged helix-turn-helix (wHTH) protein
MAPVYEHTDAQPKAPTDPSRVVSGRFRVAEWTVDPATNEVSKGAETLRLEPKVMAVLVYLAERQGKVVSREALESAVWSGTVVGYDAIAGSIQKLRRALRDNRKEPRIIETLSKKGYRLVAAVAPVVQPVAPAPPGALSEPRARRRQGLWLAGAAFGLLGRVLRCLRGSVQARRTSGRRTWRRGRSRLRCCPSRT